MNKKNEIGAIIEVGAQDWQIFQQDRKGVATISLKGRWLMPNPYKRAVVKARIVDENTLEPVTQALEWMDAHTTPGGQWAVELAGVPRGGLYRIETILQLDDAPVEWSTRGDMVHHVGVGDVWVIAGQSNAAGYGKTPTEDGPELGIHMFHADGHWKLAAHPLGDSTGTLYPPNREGGNASHSPWLAFAKRLKAALGYPIGLIPAALGGSAVAAWVPSVDGVLFRNMMRYIEDAGGVVKGCVWYQGESDAGADQRKLYARRFEEFVADFRACMKNPGLPVITAQLNRCICNEIPLEGNPDWEEMREIQRQIARKMKNVYIIPTMDLGLSDGIHTNSQGNLVIGERMASMALGGVYGKPVKFRHPECSEVRKISGQILEMVFDHVHTRLHYENNIKRDFAFVVRDEAGLVPVARWNISGKNCMRLELDRPLKGKVVVTGAPSVHPSSIVPIDICGFRPMLAFTMSAQ